ELYGGAGEGAFDAALAGIDELCVRAARVYVVSNEVFSDGAPYDPGTRRYIELLGALNRALAARADRVVEVVCGIPLIWKGGTTE
ncbi:bifunctional adenosylcobinamide kinase/adenosylcobinamide-phosphate guanylyltransferase, partial [Anaerotruncus massiliensis (ex Liu et al. 2021)]|uniref:bifunctional adenosylcobinamide kinase/adenosylcobinamide-phosphate guanylyltransferase n=2 Tax=Oscillospiraceae TaxID=216572 RepID=UPI003A87633B